MGRAVGKSDTRTLADLRPNTAVDCMVCHQAKPAAGAKPFHRLMVCAECQMVLAKRASRAAPKEQSHV